MGGLDQPTDGELILDGHSSKTFKNADYDEYRGEYLGFVFQEYNLLPEFTVEENVALGLEMIGKKADNVQEVLSMVELTGMEKRKPMELSGGQRQRVAIARAIAKDPKIIFADEPTGALDAETGKSILTLLKNLSKEKLVIVVTHDREFAEQFGDRMIEIADGRIVSDREISHEA
jgi:ABC-type lipoprotein export system ATPase subunit